MQDQRSLVCNICNNYYHYNRHCLRLTNLSDTDKEFTCYQCVDACLPFNNLSDNCFLQTSENGISLLDRGRIENIVISPYHQDLLEVHKHGDRHLLKENFHDNDIIPNSSSFYSSLEFNSLVSNRQLTENKLSFLHLNIRSIRNKFDALLNYLHLLTHKFSIIALTETWLNDMYDNSFKIHGYNLTKVNRQNKGGGGICIFTGENIKIKM